MKKYQQWTAHEPLESCHRLSCRIKSPIKCFLIHLIRTMHVARAAAMCHRLRWIRGLGKHLNRQRLQVILESHMTSIGTRMRKKKTKAASGSGLILFFERKQTHSIVVGWYWIILVALNLSVAGRWVSVRFSSDKGAQKSIFESRMVRRNPRLHWHSKLQRMKCAQRIKFDERAKSCNIMTSRYAIVNPMSSTGDCRKIYERISIFDLRIDYDWPLTGRLRLA